MKNKRKFFKIQLEGGGGGGGVKVNSITLILNDYTDTFESDKSETSSVGSEESQNLPNTDTSSDEAELELPTMADNVLEETQSEEDDVVLVE